MGVQGSLTSHKGQVLVRLGRAEGVEWLKKSYEIRSQDVPFSPRESAWAADNVATGIATLNRFDEAITWYETARDHFLEWSNQQQENKGALSPTLMLSMGRGVFWAGQTDRARDLLQGALEQIEGAEPYNWAMAAK